MGAPEIWGYYNATGDAHPMHVPEVVFEVVKRQAIFVDQATMTVQVVPGSLPVAPEPWETGYKDTVVALAGQVTRIRAQFNLAQAVFCCWRRRCWRTLAPVAEVDAAIHTVAGVVIMMDSEAGAGHYKECPHLAAYE